MRLGSGYGASPICRECLRLSPSRPILSGSPTDWVLPWSHLGREAISCCPSQLFFAEKKKMLASLWSIQANGPFQISWTRWVWSCVGDEVCMTVIDFLNGGSMPSLLKHTLIALIPKTTSPSSVNDFRPIPLYNVLYKLIAKVLANRFKRIFPNIISSSQSASVPGWSIIDNVNGGLWGSSYHEI